MHEANAMAMLWGVLATFAGAAVFAIGYMTHNLSPVERRARRVGISVAVACAALIGLAEWYLYADLAPTLGAFMLMPSIVLGMVAMWQGGSRAYRSLGGGQDAESESAGSLPPAVEPETLAHQGELWCRLRELAHMRETLGGELVNLATGDRLWWTEYRDQRCIEMRLAGRTKLIASRYETLTKYLAVQEGIASLLASFVGSK